MTNRRTYSWDEIQLRDPVLAFEIAGRCGKRQLLRIMTAQRRIIGLGLALNAAADPTCGFGGAVALNAEGQAAPEWIEVLPRGPDIIGRDGRRWRMTDPAQVVAAFAANRAHLPIDIEHAQFLMAPEGMPAPASGWIEEVAVRDGAVHARVSWTPRGSELVANREYRFISPVFTFDDKTGEIIALKGAGLVNRPNLQLPALNSEGKPAMNWLKLLAALGLPETATEDDAVAAVAALKTEKETALNQAKSPPLSLFVPRADFEAAINRETKAKADLAALEAKTRDAEIEAVVGEAVAKGQITPATKEYHLAACRTEDGLKAFKEMIAKVPVNPVAAASGLDDKKADQGAALSESQLALCRDLGLTEAEFIAAQA